jgi:hypothetical protein
VIAVALVWMAFHDGGYFPSVFTSAGALAFIALAVLLAVRPPQQRFSRRTLVATAALVAFSGWTGLSRAWTVVPDVPLLDMQRAMLYVALFGLGLLAADSGRHARLLVWSVLGVVVAVASAGLLSRLQPDLVNVAGNAAAGGYRLDYPLGYWNAFGALGSLGAVLALGLAADVRARMILRASAAAAAPLLVVAVYLSLSRGAWLALIIGVLALVAISPNRGSLLLVLLVGGVAVAVAIVRLRAYPALVTDPKAGSGQMPQGDTYMRELLIVVALAGAAQAALTAVRAPAWLPARERMLRPRMLAGAATIVVVALFAGALLAGGAVTESARDARSWVDRQWQEFLDPAAAPGPGTQRLLTARGARSDPYRVALEGFKDHPIIGGGAGSFEVRYMRDRHIDLKLRDAHSLPLETLSELGAVGLLALLVFFGAVAAAAWRGIRGTSVGRPQEAAAVTAAFVVWLVDVCVDWDWEMPALTGTAVVLSATLFQRRRRRRSSRHGDTAIA